MVFRWRADESPTLNADLIGSFVIFQGIQTSIAKKPNIIVIFQGGSGPPVPSSGSPHVLHRFKCTAVYLLVLNGIKRYES